MRQQNYYLYFMCDTFQYKFTFESLKIKISDKEYPHFESFFNNILCKYYYQLIYFKFGPRG